jgi:hypothetical protein
MSFIAVVCGVRLGLVGLRCFGKSAQLGFRSQRPWNLVYLVLAAAN